MAELTSFGYFPGESVLHKLDPRFKLLFIITLSLICLNLYLISLSFFTALLLTLIIYARLPLVSGFKELRHFFVLLVFVFVARVLSADDGVLMDLFFFSISRQGLYDGLLICWRLAFIVLLGFTLISTTRPPQIKAAVQWFLKPVALVPEKKVALMMGLILRFVPVIFDQARETAEAQKARCVHNRKNPVYRLIKLGFPLIRRAFERADDLVAAMEARGFTENRTDPDLAASRRDWVALTVVGSLCGIILLLQIIPFRQLTAASF
ncbi:MAG: energy-coupling factor transporter transmembrane component T [Desulfobacterales bacterium]|jgi:energy-coupling factor transporter transmembrane protein EcfT